MFFCIECCFLLFTIFFFKKIQYIEYILVFNMYTTGYIKALSVNIVPYRHVCEGAESYSSTTPFRVSLITILVCVFSAVEHHSPTKTTSTRFRSQYDCDFQSLDHTVWNGMYYCTDNDSVRRHGSLSSWRLFAGQFRGQLHLERNRRKRKQRGILQNSRRIVVHSWSHF